MVIMGRTNRRIVFAIGWLSLIAYLFSTTDLRFSAIRAPTLLVHERNVPEPVEESMLHLLIPATSRNPNLCRTLLSASVLDYPLPIMINWGMEEDPTNEMKMHRAKIKGILTYLRGMPASSDRDLVLIVDGHDVWFQLRPEILIQRYFRLNQERAALHARDYGPDIVTEHDITQTVIWGADKSCWPQKPHYPACYAVPESTLPENVFGDLTDGANRTFRRPRWLNAGTVLGPVADVRAIFVAADRLVDTHYNGDSDQYYFGELLGDQEYFRNQLKPQKPLTSQLRTSRDEASEHENTTVSTTGKEKKEIQKIIPEREKDQRVEFHMGLDYESRLFHTNAWASDDVKWTIFNRSEFPHDDADDDLKAVDFNLPSDITLSEPPISATLLNETHAPHAPSNMTDTLPFDLSWADVRLAVNDVSKTVPVLIHLNGVREKRFLDEWWKNNWYARQPWARYLRRRSGLAPRGPLTITTDPLTGKKRSWWKGSYNSLRKDDGGMWTGNGQFLPWKRACYRYDGVLFNGKLAGSPLPKVAQNIFKPKMLKASEVSSKVDKVLKKAVP